MRDVREVGAYNLPLRALFDKDQGGSAIGGNRLAVPGSAPEHGVGIHYTHSIVVHAAGWLPKTEAGRGDALESLVEKLGKKRLAVEPIGNGIKHLNVV